MKILRIVAEGLPLFNEKVDIDFYAKQRVSEENRANLFMLNPKLFLNPAISFIGVNASGKTSILRLILFVLNMINNQPINHIDTKNILGNAKSICLDIYFYLENTHEICLLKTNITSNYDNSEGVVYKIVDEKIWSKNAYNIITKKAIFDFSNSEPLLFRNSEEDYLSDDISIMIAINKKNKEQIKVFDLLKYTNVNTLPVFKNIPLELINYLDPTIETLYFDDINNRTLIHLKFKDKEEILLNNPSQLHNYLSSGTIKGVLTFTLAKETLLSGGYILIDELENHFNKEIAATLMRFFMDSSLNEQGGTLIFSTHYPELLDEYERTDSIYVTRNQGGITCQNLSEILKRNDIKKSDAYQSGFIGGTTPKYDAYMALNKKLYKLIKES